MAGDLVDQFRNASKKAQHRSNGLMLVCLDDESMERSAYGSMGNRTIVPVSNKEGGIYGLPRGNDCKYGAGVTRRQIGDDGNGGFVVESVEENFRPDKAPEQDLFTLAEEAEPEVDKLEELRKQAQAALSGHFEAPAATAPAAGTGNEAMMMQMMSTMMQLVAQQQQPKPAPKPAEPPKAKQPAGKNVVFSGAFGKITVRYADVMVHPAFIVLVSVPDQPTMYEPPLSASQPIQLQVDGRIHLVMNLGLSFNHKGDILLLMPLALNQEDSSAEETE